MGSDGTGSIGIVGAGTMGFEMVRAFVSAGFEVVVYDPHSPALDRAVAAGAVAETTPAGVAARTRMTLLSLPDPDGVREVVAGEEGVLEAGGAAGIIVDTSTVDPGTSRDLARRAGLLSVGYLDAPILGRPDACGRWTLPVGGAIENFEAVSSLLKPLAGEVVYVGPSGSGNVVKLLNNLMFGAIGAVTAEVLAASGELGVPMERFFKIVAGSEAATVSPLFKSLGTKVSERDFSPVFSIHLMRKDVDLALRMVEEVTGTSRLGRSVLDVADQAIGAGYGAEDVSALFKHFESTGNGGS